jgi:hypothetical protein
VKSVYVNEVVEMPKLFFPALEKVTGFAVDSCDTIQVFI